MDLDKKLKYILESELSAYSQNGRRSGGLGSFNVGLQSVPNNGWTNVGSITKYLFDDSNQNFISSENSNILLKFYSTLNSNEKILFEDLLLTFVDKKSEYKDIAYLICFIFIRLDKLEEVIEKAVKYLKGDDSNAYDNLLHMVKLVVAREYKYFSFDTLSSISEKLENDEEAIHALLPTLREACKQTFSQELDNDEGLDISKDMRNINNYFYSNFPDEDISNQIKKIEDLFEKGSFDNADYALCVDRVRVLIVSVTKLVAIEKSKLLGGKLWQNNDDKSHGKYLYDNKFLTESEHELLKAFYTVCSNNGSHLSRSTKEIARLVKNMGYEIILLLINYLNKK